MRPELKVIERGLNGLVTEKSKAEMYEALPIIVLTPKEIGIDYITNSNWFDALPYIEIHMNMTHYFKCPDLKQLEDLLSDFGPKIFNKNEKKNCKEDRQK